MNSKVRLFRRNIDGKAHYYCVSPMFFVPEDAVWHNDNQRLAEYRCTVVPWLCANSGRASKRTRAKPVGSLCTMRSKPMVCSMRCVCASFMGD